MPNNERKGYYAIIPAEVRYDADLSANAKLLYGEITALCNQEGYCWASNNYFSSLYGVSKDTISDWVSQLGKKGYIVVKLIANGREGREIYLPSTGKTPRYLGENTLGINTSNTTVNTGAVPAQEVSPSEESPSPDMIPSFEEWKSSQGVESDYEDDNLVHRLNGKPVSENKLKQLYQKDYPKPLIATQKPRRAEFHFDFEVWLEKLRTSSAKTDKIVALIWFEKGYRFENYEQWKTQFDLDKKYAAMLKGYAGTQILDAIRACQKDAEGKFDWKASTVVKKIAELNTHDE